MFRMGKEGEQFNHREDKEHRGKKEEGIRERGACGAGKHPQTRMLAPQPDFRRKNGLQKPQNVIFGLEIVHFAIFPPLTAQPILLPFLCSLCSVANFLLFRVIRDFRSGNSSFFSVALCERLSSSVFFLMPQLSWNRGEARLSGFAEGRGRGRFIAHFGRVKERC